MIRGVGPTTGVTIPAGSTATVAWNGTDFVDVAGYIGGNLVINGNLTVKGNTTLGDAVGDTLTVNATSTFNNADVTIYGITVGRGAGAVSTNTAVGASALAANTTGTYNIGVGYLALTTISTANYNVAIGGRA